MDEKPAINPSTIGTMKVPILPPKSPPGRRLPASPKANPVPFTPILTFDLSGSGRATSTDKQNMMVLVAGSDPANTLSQVQTLVLNGRDYEIVPIGNGQWITRNEYELMRELTLAENRPKSPLVVSSLDEAGTMEPRTESVERQEDEIKQINDSDARIVSSDTSSSESSTVNEKDPIACRKRKLEEADGESKKSKLEVNSEMDTTGGSSPTNEDNKEFIFSNKPTEPKTKSTDAANGTDDAETASQNAERISETSKGGGSENCKVNGPRVEKISESLELEGK